MLMENLNSLDLAKKWMFSFVSLIGEGQKVRFTIWTVLGVFFFLMVYKYILNAFICFLKRRGAGEARDRGNRGNPSGCSLFLPSGLLKLPAN